MESVQFLIDWLKPVLPLAIVTAGVIVALVVTRRFLERAGGVTAGHAFRDQLIMLGLTAVGGLLVVVFLPISDSTRGQLLSLIGIVLSAAIALSSTTLLGNGMAGLMLRAVRSFRAGDFVKVGDQFGRVSERGLFHTEIQTESRDLTTLPNLYLVTNPVTVIRSSGTILSTTVSLGYDVPRSRIETLLLEAAKRAEYEDAFVQILELGDFSVTYRIAGLLKDVKQILSARSRLRGCVMDALHEGGVEIVSPNFMNQKILADGTVFIPETTGRAAPRRRPAVSLEELAFDKAEEAESIEALQLEHERLSEKAGKTREAADDAPEGPEREALEAKAAAYEARRDRIALVIKAREEGDRRERDGESP